METGRGAVSAKAPLEAAVHSCGHTEQQASWADLHRFIPAPALSERALECEFLASVFRVLRPQFPQQLSHFTLYAFSFRLMFGL